MSRGLAISWLLFGLGAASTLLPHLFAHAFLDNAAVVRWIAACLLLVSAPILAGHYLF